MKAPITQNLIAPCGMNCGICRAFLRAELSVNISCGLPICYEMEKVILQRKENI
jgi:hypothetical protein